MGEEDLTDEALISNARDSSIAIDGPAAVPIIKTPVTLAQLLFTFLLPGRLTKLALLTPLSLPPITNEPSLHPPITSILSVLHLRALEALNNLLLIVLVSAQSGSISFPQPLAMEMWNSLFQIVSTISSERQALEMKGQEIRMELLDISLGCLWGAAKISSAHLVSNATETRY